MFYFSNLVDSATAGDTLEDNQPLSAKCTSWSGGLEKAYIVVEFLFQEQGVTWACSGVAVLPVPIAQTGS